MLPVGEGPTHIRTIIVTAIASLTLTGTSLGDWGAELTASGGVFGDQFGQSVALDGDTCVIGARGTNSNTGSAYVFTSDASGNWSQVAELTASNAANYYYFGSGVAIDGDTCVIGAEGTNSDTGIAYVYGSTSGQTGVVGDLDGDGDVDTDIDDLLNVVEGWGITCH